MLLFFFMELKDKREKNRILLVKLLKVLKIISMLRNQYSFRHSVERT